jgi:hypothetical protein
MSKDILANQLQARKQYKHVISQYMMKPSQQVYELNLSN